MSEKLDLVLPALADPTRRAILARLADGELGAMEIAEPFAISQPAVSRHLKVLEEAGLISRRVDGKRRPCRLNPDGLAAIEAFCARLREIHAMRFERLDALLEDLQRKETP